MTDSARPQLLTASMVAAELGVTPSAIYDELAMLKASGVSVAQSIDGRLMIDLDAFVQARDVRRRARRIRRRVAQSAVQPALANALATLFAAAVADLIGNLESRAVELAQAAHELGTDGARAFLHELAGKLQEGVQRSTRLAVNGLRAE